MRNDYEAQLTAANQAITQLEERLRATDEDEVRRMVDSMNGKFSQLSRQNDELKYKLRNEELKTRQMEDQLRNEAAASSKMLVGGNQNAKAQHFQKVKMELVGAQQRNHVLEKELAAAQDRDKEALKLATVCFQDFAALSTTLGSTVALSDPELKAMKTGQSMFSTTGYALTKL